MTLYGVIVWLLVRETLPGREVSDESKPSPEQRDEEIPLRDAIGTMLADSPFVMFCFAGFLCSCVFMQCISTLPVYIREAGFSHSEFGTLMSINGVLIVLLQLPAAHWTSRFNAMSVIVVGSCFVAVGFGSTGFGTGFSFLAVTVVLWTLGEILNAPYQHSIVTDLAPVSLRARYLGMFGLCVGFSLTIGAPLGGMILTRFGSQSLWAASFVVALTAIGCYLASYAAITNRIKRAEVQGVAVAA